MSLWGVAIAIISLLVAMACSELALGSTKLQTGLPRVVLVWMFIFIADCFLLARFGHTGPIAFTMFWGGSFLSWFGVRSHIESSILLRMLYLLRRQPLEEKDLLAQYALHYGPEHRMEELFRGGLAVREGDRRLISQKGKAILRIVSHLR